MGSLLLTVPSLGGLALAQWLGLLPGTDPRWSGIAFLGVLLLPAVALMRLEHEAGLSRSLLARALMLTGAFLPALLLPAQIVGVEVCLAPGACAPARVLILLSHLFLGALLLLLALPAIEAITRASRSGGGLSIWRSSGGALYMMAALHLATILLRIGDTALMTLLRELATTGLQLVLMQLLLMRVMALRNDAAAAPTAAAPMAAAELAVGEQPAPAAPAALAADSAPLPLPAPEKVSVSQSIDATVLEKAPNSDSFPPTEGELAAANAAQTQDPGLQARISADAIALIRGKHLYRQPQLRRKEVAEQLKVADYLLSRSLNAATGKSFIDLVNGLRIEEARQRIRAGEGRITTIGYDVGFNSLAAFNRAFRDATGQSPSEYRHGTGEQTADSSMPRFAN
ncbi:MAG TPA: helix-turn-helix transcriptional regulator [Polaromonas sp.]|nr:helix-turn-helix transcriptional regulator [Polaromonas sp.]